MTENSGKNSMDCIAKENRLILSVRKLLFSQQLWTIGEQQFHHPLAPEQVISAAEMNSREKIFVGDLRKKNEESPFLWNTMHANAELFVQIKVKGDISAKDDPFKL